MILLLNKPRYCLECWGGEYHRIRDTCLLAEKLGYYGFFYGESLTNLDFDCWTVISSLISLTKIIKLGPVITYINPEYRSLALLAKQSITFQDISAGRLEFRTGAGAASKYSISWWNPYGINYPNAGVRLTMLEEGISLFRKLIGKTDSIDKSNGSSSGFARSNDKKNGDYGNPVYHDGEYFKTNGAIMTKPILDIPITIAAKSKRMLQIAAKYSDIWESSYMSPTQFSSMNLKFHKVFQTTGNTVSSVFKNASGPHPKKSIELEVLIAESEKELQKKKAVLEKERGTEAYNQILGRGLIGICDEIHSLVSKYVDLGVEQFLLAFQDPFDVESIELFMKSVK